MCLTVCLGSVQVLGVLPRTPDAFVPHACAACLFGFTATWVGPGVDRPIFVTVVQPEVRATIQSWWFLFAGTFGALAGAPSVGWLAETLYGYRMPVHAPVGATLAANASLPDAAASALQDAANADALARALLACTLVPWGLCFLCYSALHVTLPMDYRRAKGAGAKQ